MTIPRPTHYNRTTMSRLLPIVLLLAGLAGFTGCSSYVNIPPAKGDVARSNPNTATVRNVEQTAVSAVAGRVNAPGPASVRLPAGSTLESYDAVMEPLGEQFIPVTEERSGEAQVQYVVRGVRVRAYSAEADVAATGPTGIAQVYTVHMSYAPLSGWGVDRIQNWGTIGDPSSETDKPQPDKPNIW